MAHRDSTEPTGNPVHELQRRLLLANGPKAKLNAYMSALPAIVTFSPPEAVTFAGDADRVATELREWMAQVEILRLRARGYLLLNNPSAALDDLRLACSYAGEAEDETVAIPISLSIGEALVKLGDPVAALIEYQDALKRCGSDATSLRADALEALANLHLSTGDYHRTIGFLREALVIRTEIDEPAGIGRILSAIGTAFGKMDELPTAYDYHRQSLEVFRETGDIGNEIRALANLASLQQSRGELNDAIELAWKAHAACSPEDDPITAAGLTITIADLHRNQGEPDLALKHYLKAHEILQKFPPDDLLLSLYHRIGWAHESMNDLDAAQLVYRYAIEIAEKTGERQVRSELHHALSGLFERIGYYQDALHHCQQFARLQHELAGEEQRRKIAEVQVKYDMLKVERDLHEARDRARRLEEDVEMTRQELAEARMDLTGTTVKLEKITSKVARLKDAGAGNRKEIVEGIVKEIEKHPSEHGRPEIRSATVADREWEKLKRDLDKQYPEFIEKLAAICPTLTITEVKICALTKLLGGDTVEIARILHNTQRTVQTQRLKIRRKLGLPGDVNFATFLDTL